MTKTLFALPLIAVLMATSAYAQTSETGTSGSGTEGSSGNQTGQSGTEGDTATSAIIAKEGAEAEAGSGEAWPSTVGTTFFTDSQMGSLRTPEEVQSGWSSLSADDQARVRQDCATYGGGASATGTATDTTATATDQTSMTGTFPTGVSAANMTQICDWVNSF